MDSAGKEKFKQSNPKQEEREGKKHKRAQSSPIKEKFEHSGRNRESTSGQTLSIFSSIRLQGISFDFLDAGSKISSGCPKIFDLHTMFRIPHP